MKITVRWRANPSFRSNASIEGWLALTEAKADAELWRTRYGGGGIHTVQVSKRLEEGGVWEVGDVRPGERSAESYTSYLLLGQDE